MTSTGWLGADDIDGLAGIHKDLFNFPDTCSMEISKVIFGKGSKLVSLT